MKVVSMLAAICPDPGPEGGWANGVSLIGDMSGYPILQVAKKEVVRAGLLLREKLPDDPARMAEYREAFRVACDWRDAHYCPMRGIRYELAGKVRRLGVGAIAAARIKKMASIRKKLSGSTIKLVQIQGRWAKAVPRPTCRPLPRSASAGRSGRT